MNSSIESLRQLEAETRAENLEKYRHFVAQMARDEVLSPKDEVAFTLCRQFLGLDLATVERHQDTLRNINGLESRVAGRSAAYARHEEAAGLAYEHSQATKEIIEARRGEQGRLDGIAYGAKNLMRLADDAAQEIERLRKTPILFEQAASVQQIVQPQQPTRGIGYFRNPIPGDQAPAPSRWLGPQPVTR